MKKWSIKQMIREQNSGLVISAIWEISQDKAEKILTGSSHFERSADFTPFEQLTEQVVVQWVHDQLGSIGITAFEKAHDDQIERQANVVASPEIEAGLPWPQETTV